MVRPLIDRNVAYIPEIKKFIPLTENSDENILDNILLLEEIEAIRLKDFEGFDQQECADLMNVSRPTFRRILLSARAKISDSLLNGKSITIDVTTENISVVLQKPNMGRGRRMHGKHGFGGKNRQINKNEMNF